MCAAITARNSEIHIGKFKVLEGHTLRVSSVSANDNLIISCSGDKTIKIWDIDSGSCLKTLKDHTHCIMSVFVKDNLIISGSADNTIRITPISLFPEELSVFQSVVDSYAPHLDREILQYFSEK